MIPKMVKIIQSVSDILFKNKLEWIPCNPIIV